MWLDPGRPGISEELARKGGREFAFMWILRTESVGTEVAYDVGANIGYTTIPLALNSKVVHAFEPDKRSRKLLKLNALKNVKIHSHAVSDNCLGTSFALSKKPNQSGMFSKGKGVRVPTVTLDTYAKFADNPVFIKSDIEGAEVEMLRGAMKIIEGNSTVKILMELHPTQYGKGRRIEDQFEILKDNGFELKYVVNAKGMMERMLAEPVKIIDGYSRAVFPGFDGAEDMCTRFIKGKKMIRSVLWVRSRS